MHKVKLVVRVVSDQAAIGGYVRDLELPFIPSIGMRFEQGVSTGLWQTWDGELCPSVEEVVYDLDEGAAVCLFTIKEKLSSTFWTELRVAELGVRCAELGYFRSDGQYPIKQSTR